MTSIFASLNIGALQIESENLLSDSSHQTYQSSQQTCQLSHPSFATAGLQNSNHTEEVMRPGIAVVELLDIEKNRIDH
jgi:hypothetical protein